MRNKTVFSAIAGVLLLAAGLPLLAQGGPRGGNGMRNCTGQCPMAGIGPAGVASQPLTSDESKWLLFMREEEKLARDVYELFYSTWKISAFNNIGTAEQRHFEVVGILLKRYGLADPAQGQTGVFTDARLQTTYNDLISKGPASLSAALQAGVAIEQQDIKALETALAATNKTDIKRVYSNLLSGSLNHLSAFESRQEVLGARP